MFIVWFHVQCDALTLAATLKASRQIKNADSVNQRIINVPNLIPIRLETTQPYLDFLARDSIYAIARYMPSPVRPSVRPSVCLSVRHTGGSVKDV